MSLLYIFIYVMSSWSFQNTYTNADKLLEAAEQLAQTGECDPEEIYKAARHLEVRIQDFVRRVEHRKLLLDMSVSFHTHTKEVGLTNILRYPAAACGFYLKWMINGLMVKSLTTQILMCDKCVIAGFVPLGSLQPISSLSCCCQCCLLFLVFSDGAVLRWSNKRKSVC